jgi:hypothetical protein
MANILDEAFGLGLLKGMEIVAGRIKPSKEDAENCRKKLQKLALDYNHSYEDYNKEKEEKE